MTPTNALDTLHEYLGVGVPLGADHMFEVRSRAIPALARVKAAIEAARRKREHEHNLPVLMGAATYQDWANEDRALGAALDAALAALEEA